VRRHRHPAAWLSPPTAVSAPGEPASSNVRLRIR
jgi:hypothetical protein